MKVNYCLDSNIGLSFFEADLDIETGYVSFVKNNMDGVKNVYRESIQLKHEDQFFNYEVGYEKINDAMTFAFKVLCYKDTQLFKMLNSEKMKNNLEQELSVNAGKSDKKNKC